jgi:UDP-glucose 4-epimerase
MTSDLAGAPRVVLVTGGAGFIGASLVRSLLGQGSAVRVFDDLSTGTAAYLPDGVELLRGDIRDTAALASAVDGSDAVVHLAAHASVPGSIADPRFDFDRNVAGTFNVLEAARLAGVQRVVLASSNAVAGTAGPVARPDAQMRPIAPYGAAKAAGEVYGHAYTAAYEMTVTALRFSNVYGPYSLHKSSVVAAFVRAAVAGEPVTIFGDGEQTRDYVHVDDLVAGIVAGLTAPADAAAAGPFQLGTGVETTINALVNALEEVCGRPLERRHVPPRAGDVLRNVSDISGSRERLGYAPAVELAAGLAKTVAWWREAIDDAAYAGVAAGSGSD